MLDRYVLDLHRVLVEIHRVLLPGATAVLVIGNSRVRGVFIRNARALTGAAERIGLRLTSEDERVLPPDRRYLPPPRTPGASGLEKRMRSETVLTFTR